MTTDVTTSAAMWPTRRVSTSGWGSTSETRELQDLKTELKELNGAREAEHRKLKEYLRAVGGHNGNQNSVDQILRYCNDLMTERNRYLTALDLERQRFHQERSAIDLQLKSATARADKLEAQYQLELNNLAHANNAAKHHEEMMAVTIKKYEEEMERAHKEHRKADEAAARLSTETLNQVTEEHRKEVAKLELEGSTAKQSYEAEVANLHRAYSSQLQKRDVDHQQSVDKFKLASDNQLVEFIAQHEEATRDLNLHILNLEDELSQMGDFRPATDRALTSRFADLKSLIARATLPRNLSLSPMASLPPSLDLDGSYAMILRSHGQKHLQFVLRSLFWDVLGKAFFSAPFGFGFLGQEGQLALMTWYDSWLMLYGGDTGDMGDTGDTGDSGDSGESTTQHASLQDPDLTSGTALGDWSSRLAVFGGDNFQANMYRSAMFLSLSAAVKGDQQPPGIAAQLYKKLQGDVRDKLYGILAEMTEHKVPPAVEEELPRIVRVAAELALEIGVQRALVSVVKPMGGEEVVIGDEFHDCLHGDSMKGQKFKVELLVSPGLLKIGDGRGNTSVRKSLVPAELFRGEEVPRQASRAV